MSLNRKFGFWLINILDCLFFRKSICANNMMLNNEMSIKRKGNGNGETIKLDQVKMSRFLESLHPKGYAQITYICKRCCDAEIFVFPFHWWFQGFFFSFFRKASGLEVFKHQAGRAWHSDIAAKFRTNLSLPLFPLECSSLHWEPDTCQTALFLLASH